MSSIYTCSQCKQPIYPKHGNTKFCYFHYFINLFAHNDDKNHMGIISFAFTLFGNRFKREWGVAQMHRDMLWQVLYDEPGLQREDRATAIATFRGGAKTTWFSFILPMYVAAMNDHGIYVGDYKLPVLDYIVLKSKVGTSAQKNLFNIQNALREPDFINFFGDLRPTIRQVKAKDGKDTSKLMILSNGFICEAIGINQQIRGTNILGKRPKIILYDDPETGENTKTEERRHHNAMDVLDESWGALDESVGRIVYIANMVHEDCLLKHLLANPSWNHLFFQLTYKENGVEKITWPQKYNWAKIAKIKAFYLSHPKLGIVSYWRNYYNINKTDVAPILQKKKGVQYFRHGNQNWIKYKDDEGKEIIENVYITVGYDAAVTQRSSGSKTSIVIEAQNAKKKKFVLEYKYGSYDSHDRYLEHVTDDKRPKIIALEGDELALILRRGGIEESVRMILKYNADAFAMGVESQQGGYFRDIQDILQRIGFNCVTYPVQTAGRDGQTKITRLRDWILRQFENRVYYLCGDMYELCQELETFPQSKLDILDGLYYADQIMIVPSLISYDKENPKQYIPVILPNIESEESWAV